MERPRAAVGFGWPWFALTVAFALHVFDEATTGFLAVYNPTVIAMRARWGWFPMPTFQFREWLLGLLVGVAVCFCADSLRRARRALDAALGRAVRCDPFFQRKRTHTRNDLGHTVSSVTFPRPAPGFYSSPLLLIGSVWLMVRLRKTAGTE